MMPRVSAAAARARRRASVVMEAPPLDGLGLAPSRRGVKILLALLLLGGGGRRHLDWCPRRLAQELAAGAVHAGTDAHVHRQALSGVPAERAADRRDISVVAPAGEADVALARRVALRRVEAEPPFARDEDLRPGVRGEAAAHLVAGVGVREEVPRDVAAGNAADAGDGEQEVREVLAHAGARREHLIRGRVDVRGALLVAEALADEARGRAAEAGHRGAARVLRGRD